MAAAAARTRRRWSAAEKRRLVELASRDGATVSAIARAHGLSATSLFRWRDLFGNGKLGVANPVSAPKLLPVVIEGNEMIAPIARATVATLTLPGGVQFRLEGDVLDASLLCALLAQVGR